MAATRTDSARSALDETKIRDAVHARMVRILNVDFADMTAQTRLEITELETQLAKVISERDQLAEEVGKLAAELGRVRERFAAASELIELAEAKGGADYE